MGESEFDCIVFGGGPGGHVAAIRVGQLGMKTVFDATTGELLGAHLFGSEVTGMIHGFAIAPQPETTEAELIHAVFPHPTLSGSMHESMLDAFRRALNF